MKKIKEISISDYKPNSSSMINRHYYFDIKLLFEDNSDKVINKRYSEIEELYKVLLLKYPGCRIPKFPKKTFSMNILIKEEEKKDIIKKMEKFLNYIINHKNLSEKNIVNEFFSNHAINEDHSLKTDIMKINEDDINDSGFVNNEDFNNSDNKKNDEDKNDIIADFEQLEFKSTPDYEIWLENNLLNDVLNMFLEDQKEGIINKTKGFIASTYNYLMPSSSQENFNNNISETNICVQEENFKYTEQISEELGEVNYVNEYGDQIKKMNEGLSDLIDNIIGMKKINEKKINSLKNIQEIWSKDINNKSSKKEKDSDGNNDVSEKSTTKKIENRDKWDNKIFKGEINNKLKGYISINTKYYEDDFEKILNNINESKEALEELKEIFDRKSSHIYFLIKLNSKLTELEKQTNKENFNQEKDTNKKNNNVSNKDYNIIKRYVDIEKQFIFKLNKDLKYEIDYFKENIENNIYNCINELFTKYYYNQNKIYEKLNEEISLESDSSEHSNKDDSFEKNDSFENIDSKKENKRKESKGSKDSFTSGEDF